jgi:hypothetical protein
VRRRTLIFVIAGLASSVLPVRAQKDRKKQLAVDIDVGNDRPDPVLAILREIDAKGIQQVNERGLGGIETVVHMAPINGPPVFPMNHPSASSTVPPACTCARRCTGTTASRKTHHMWTGAKRNAASKIALGGQKVAMEV